MLLLIFDIGEGRYAMGTSQVAEIVPLVHVKKIPQSASYIAGLMNYRGLPVPVIDLSYLLRGSPCEKRLSTRIILIHYPLEDKDNALLGLIAEQVTETMQSDLKTRPSGGVVMDEALYQDGMRFGNDEMIQWFDIDQMLPKDEVRLLFNE